jgi:hypothetical protein
MNSPIVIALVHPLNLFMLGASIFAGLVSAWWMFPLGLLIWLIMVIIVARDPAIKLNLSRGKRTALSQRFQPYFDRIERSQFSIFNSLSNAPLKVRNAMQPVVDEMDNLVNATYDLCQRMTTLDNYRRVAELRSNLSSELKQIEKIIAQTQDPLVRQDYEETRRTLQARLDDQKALRTLMERVEAQLTNQANEVDRVVADVIRLQAMGEKETRQQIGELVVRLRSEQVELTRFEQEALKQHSG